VNSAETLHGKHLKKKKTTGAREMDGRLARERWKIDSKERDETER